MNIGRKCLEAAVDLRPFYQERKRGSMIPEKEEVSPQEKNFKRGTCRRSFRCAGEGNKLLDLKEGKVPRKEIFAGGNRVFLKKEQGKSVMAASHQYRGKGV